MITLKNIYLLLLFVLAFTIGCSEDGKDDDNSTILGPNTGGTGGTGAVTFTISHQVLQEGQDFDGDGQADDSFYLTASPSVAVKITTVTIGIPNNPNFDAVQGDGTSVFNANQAVQINNAPYFNVSSGQKFTLKFTGNLASDNQSFEITSEYTVP